jgi:hypothetical protein
MAVDREGCRHFGSLMAQCDSELCAVQTMPADGMFSSAQWRQPDHSGESDRAASSVKQDRRTCLDDKRIPPRYYFCICVQRGVGHS